MCGGKWVQYTEKFSQKQKEDGLFAHKICQKCYSKAVARKCKSFIALPGLLNVRAMIPANKDLGRCDVCDTGAAMGGPGNETEDLSGLLFPGTEPARSYGVNQPFCPLFLEVLC